MTPRRKPQDPRIHTPTETRADLSAASTSGAIADGSEPGPITLSLPDGETREIGRLFGLLETLAARREERLWRIRQGARQVTACPVGVGEGAASHPGFSYLIRRVSVGDLDTVDADANAVFEILGFRDMPAMCAILHPSGLRVHYRLPAAPRGARMRDPDGTLA